ncbi:MAG TPA: hypothetical protein VHO01_15270 [Jatrophihabitans sp.]|nr:hypothetical protein [Jatrophihabitans sp.]
MLRGARLLAVTVIGCALAVAVTLIGLSGSPRPAASGAARSTAVAPVADPRLAALRARLTAAGQDAATIRRQLLALQAKLAQQLATPAPVASSWRPQLPPVPPQQSATRRAPAPIVAGPVAPAPSSSPRRAQPPPSSPPADEGGSPTATPTRSDDD